MSKFIRIIYTEFVKIDPVLRLKKTLHNSLKYKQGAAKKRLHQFPPRKNP